MKVKSVSVDPGLLNETVTDHARKLGFITDNDMLKLQYFEVDQPEVGVIFKKESKS